MAGMWYEDFEIGAIIQHPQRRTISEFDNILFNSLTMNPQPLHLDEEFAKTQPVGTRTVNGVLTLGLVTGIPVYETTLGTTIAHVSFEQINFLKPVVHGDTIHVETEVLDKRESASRPNAGLVKLAHRGMNQRDEVVCEVRRTALMSKRPTA